MTTETTNPTAESAPDATPPSAPSAPQTKLQSIHDDLHAILVKLEDFERDVVADLRAGITALASKLKELL